MSQDKIAVIVGVGPGLGAAIARRFAREGFAVALMARQSTHLEPLRQELEAAGGQALVVPLDATDPNAVEAGFAEVQGQLGPPQAVIYNVGAFMWTPFLEIEAGDFERCWQANCYGAFLVSQASLPAMLARGGGTLIFTGATAALWGRPGFTCLAVGKAGLRSLAETLAREYGAQGIHVVHAVIDGQVNTPKLRAAEPDRAPETVLSPEAVAETYWQLHCQDPTAWTLEIDLRPAAETF